MFDPEKIVLGLAIIMFLVVHHKPVRTSWRR